MDRKKAYELRQRAKGERQIGLRLDAASVATLDRLTQRYGTRAEVMRAALVALDNAEKTPNPRQ